MTNRISTLVLLFLACSSLCYSQTTLQKADKNYAFKAFNEAIINYQNIIENDPENVNAILGLARSYADINDYLNATKYFAIASSESNLEKSDLVIYANTLRKMAKYNEARLQYEKIKMYDASLASHFLLSCDYAEHLLSSSNDYSIKSFQNNSAFSEYGIRQKGQSLIWMVIKNERDRLCPTSLEISGDIIKTFRSDDVIPTTSNSDCFIMTDYAAQGDVSVVMQSERKVYSPLSFDHANAYLKIITENNGNNYEEYFPFNEIGYCVAYPQISDDGSKIYFSSDKPGGYGGFDIYVTENLNGEWTEPKNLGPVINSIGDEITPYFDGRTMYFASNYLHGLGGYDLFKSESYNGKYTFPSNLGNGVNSPQDDVFPFKQGETGLLYFSSNRLGSLGGFDIYSAYKKNEFPVALLSDEAKPELAMTDYKKNASEDNMSSDVEMMPVAERLRGEKNIVQVSSEWEGALMTSFDESLWNGTPVYFIQLAAISKKNPDRKAYEVLSKYGNIYSMHSSNVTKIRLGYFFDESEARSVLNSVKKSGYSDAFITRQPLETKDLELLISNASYETDSYMVPKKFKGTSGYKVRLASYENPKWFNINKAKDIGKIEQWSKGGWTIFVLSGYESQEDAARARIKALNQGFIDAQVVYDNNGLLEKIKTN